MCNRNVWLYIHRLRFYPSVEYAPTDERCFPDELDLFKAKDGDQVRSELRIVEVDSLQDL